MSEGDIVSVLENGVVNVLWQCNSDENLLFLTDYCNSHCIMCPQTQLPNIAQLLSTGDMYTRIGKRYTQIFMYQWW